MEKRSPLVRVLGREVPFLRELEEVDRLSGVLIQIAGRARPPRLARDFRRAARSPYVRAHGDVSNTVLEAVASRSRAEREDIEAVLLEMLLVLLRAGRLTRLKRSGEERIERVPILRAEISV